MSEHAASQPDPEPVVIRDKRRVDRASSARPSREEVAESAGGAGTAEAEAEAEAGIPKAQALLLEERTRDLQRVQAEFANYRRRVERDRIVVGEQAVGGVLAALLPVLDDIDRARSHGDLTGAFKAVADQLDAVLSKLGLESFGEPGDPFDPAVHEAVLHSESDEVGEPTATTVMRKGYRQGERLLRPAMVGVTDPVAPPQAATEAQAEPAQQTSAPQPQESASTEQANPKPQREGVTDQADTD